jgi:hypothetical protein
MNFFNKSLTINNFSTRSRNIQCNPPLVIENFSIVPRGGKKNCDLGDLNMTNKTNKIASFINRLGSVVFAIGQTVKLVTQLIITFKTMFCNLIKF